MGNYLPGVGILCHLNKVYCYSISYILYMNRHIVDYQIVDFLEPL
jgi:hypothetical protein